MKGEASEVGSALLGAPSIWRCSAQGVQCLRLCGAERIPRPRIAVCYRKPRPQQKLETRNDAAEHRHHFVVGGRRQPEDAHLTVLPHEHAVGDDAVKVDVEIERAAEGVN